MLKLFLTFAFRDIILTNLYCQMVTWHSEGTISLGGTRFTQCSNTGNWFVSLLHATLSGTVIFLLLLSFRCQASTFLQPPPFKVIWHHLPGMVTKGQLSGQLRLLLNLSDLWVYKFLYVNRVIVVGGWTGKFGVPHVHATEQLGYAVDATFSSRQTHSIVPCTAWV